MSFVYGATQLEPGKTQEFFPVTVDVQKKISDDPQKRLRKLWPYYPVVFKRGDTGEKIGLVLIPIMGSMVLDESNVFDILEYLAYNFGESPAGKGNSPYDLTLKRLDCVVDIGAQSSVTLKRGVGCRHFILNTNGKRFHVTVDGPGIENDITRHDVSELLFINALPQGIGSWTAGTTTKGFNVSFYNTDDKSFIPVQYTIPFAFTPSPKETSRLQIVSAKKFVENPDVFANSGAYDPYRLIKHVITKDFWYLKSGDKKILVTLIQNPSFKAMGAVTQLIDGFTDKEERMHYLSNFTTMMKNSVQQRLERRDYDKAIIKNCLNIIEYINSDVTEDVNS